YELFARIWPAREVSGDLYDVFPTEDGRLAFLIGDVSGKGMPAALFMFAVRSLGRHLAISGASPAETLRRLNAALARDNPSTLFVTLILGIYTPDTGELVGACGGHPAPLLRRASGAIEELGWPTGRLLGFPSEGPWTDQHLRLQHGETLILY